MNIRQDKLEILDQILAAYLQNNKEFQNRWLFEQTLYTSMTRRSIFQYFPFQPHSVGLDAGTGFGILPLELAGQMPITIHGVDIDEAELAIAHELKAELQGMNYFQEGSQVQFQQGDLYSLSFAEATFDFIISRFVYQHLRNPEAVSDEFFRVMKTGGYLCIIDIDDQFSISYPQSNAFQRLEKAFSDLQSLRGGDRLVGRKIPAYLHAAGFQILATLVQPQAQYALNKPSDMGNQFMLRRFYEAKEEIIAKGILREGEFDRYIDALTHEEDRYQFNANAQVIVIARKP